MPTLVLDDGEVLVESASILDYLDEAAGLERALLPASGAARRTALQLMSLAIGAAEKGRMVIYESAFRPEDKRHEPWLDRCPVLQELPSEERLQLSSALYEALANVVEHGYGGDAARQLDLWWLTDTLDSDREPAGPGPSPVSTTDLDARVRAGCFVLRDGGQSFRPDGWQRSDFLDPAVRRRSYELLATEFALART